MLWWGDGRAMGVKNLRWAVRPKTNLVIVGIINDLCSINRRPIESTWKHGRWSSKMEAIDKLAWDNQQIIDVWRLTKWNYRRSTIAYTTNVQILDIVHYCGHTTLLHLTCSKPWLETRTWENVAVYAIALLRMWLSETTMLLVLDKYSLYLKFLGERWSQT
jgi:hypothetical protein